MRTHVSREFEGKMEAPNRGRTAPQTMRHCLPLPALAAFLSIGSLLHAEQITVNFTSTKHTLSPLTFSMVESGYGANNTELPNSPAQQTNINNLNIAMMRMNLGYKTPGDPNSTIVCQASGASQTITGDQWVSAIRAAGAEPEIRVQMATGQNPFGQRMRPISCATLIPPEELPWRAGSSAMSRMAMV